MSKFADACAKGKDGLTPKDGGLSLAKLYAACVRVSDVALENSKLKLGRASTRCAERTTDSGALVPCDLPRHNGVEIGRRNALGAVPQLSA
jgi:hypothetical protein